MSAKMFHANILEILFLLWISSCPNIGKCKWTEMENGVTRSSAAQDQLHTCSVLPFHPGLMSRSTSRFVSGSLLTTFRISFYEPVAKYKKMHCWGGSKMIWWARIWFFLKWKNS